MRKISPTPGFDPRTVQPVASRYTDYAIPAHATSKYNHKKYIHSIQWKCKLCKQRERLESSCRCKGGLEGALGNGPWPKAGIIWGIRDYKFVEINYNFPYIVLAKWNYFFVAGIHEFSKKSRSHIHIRGVRRVKWRKVHARSRNSRLICKHQWYLVLSNSRRWTDDHICKHTVPAYKFKFLGRPDAR